jgi:hypothetical protein
MPPSPDLMFQIANPVALIGWLALALSPLSPRLTQVIAGLVIPLLLATLYAGLILAHWSTAPGGFGSLAQVMALFTSPPVALAGWVHYLAFDMLIGAWIARTAAREGISHLLVLPCLALTFLFGPIGFLTFSTLRALARSQRAAR